MGRRDMIAIDGSEQAKNAFGWYLDNMYRDGDTVVLIHIAEYNIDIGLPGIMADVNAICEQMKKRNEEIGSMTDGYMNTLREKHVNAKLLTLNGEKPGQAITESAKKEDVSSIIMGTRGLGTLRRTLLGSVSEYVIHNANCPVTIVRQKDDSQLSI